MQFCDSNQEITEMQKKKKKTKQQMAEKIIASLLKI